MKRIFLTVFYIIALLPNVFSQTATIRETTTPKGWIIETHSSAYQLLVDEKGNVKPVYYGNSEQASFAAANGLWQQAVMEIPVRGSFPNKTPMIELIFPDQVRDIELQFVGGEIINKENRTTLVITQKDRYYPLQVVSYIRVIPELDILEKWVEISNTGKKGKLLIENLQSGNIVLPKNNYRLTHLAGLPGREFQLQQTTLTPGIKTLESRDFKSFDTPPWFMIRPQDETARLKGAAWFGSIQYSGNWRIDFDVRFSGEVQVVSGINFWDTHLNLEAGKSFTSPKMIVGYTEKGDEGASQNMAAYIRKNLLPASHRDKLRPVLYNSWYATEFNVNEEQQLNLAKVAKEIGVELFVIDDGWFKGRVNDRAGLGDWTVDQNKFPNGLQPMIQKINDMGMDFGIWIEPEMVNPNSDLYRQHPDWAFHFPNRTRDEGRHQLMLNLANEEVYQYLLKCYVDLLSANNIRFVKWDHNRTLSQPGWPNVPVEKQREVRIRYIENLYRLIDELRTRFPDVWFETCSSGGGRPDLGMLSKMDQVWISDNVNPLDRLFIQYGYLSAWPANTMVAWVTDWLQNTSLEFTFDVMMSGVLGVGSNLTKWGDKEKNIAKEKIALYKTLRPLVQQGITYRLISPFEDFRSAIEYVSEDASSAVVFCYNLADYMSRSHFDTRGDMMLRLQGLSDSKNYKLEFCGLAADKQSQRTYTGKFLKEIGLPWPVRGEGKCQIIRIY